ncbi:transposase, partial [Pseudoalteromonas sp. S1731]
YFHKPEYTTTTQLIKQTPKAEYNQDIRPHHGTATAQPLRPGRRYEIAATIADIYMVDDNDPHKGIGRPTIYLVIDVF